MAVVIGLHGNVCYPINTGRVTYYEQPSCCLVKYFVCITHWVSGWDCYAYQGLGSSAMLRWMFTTSFDVMQLLRKLCISSHDVNFT